MKSKPSAGTVSRATSRQLLPAPEPPVPEGWRHHYARLMELREMVIQETEELAQEAAELAPASSRQPVEAAGDWADRELTLGLLAYEQNALEEIDAALRRIQEGRYGVCEMTGLPIPRRRLEAIPWARHTIEAQAELEWAGEAPKRAR